MKYKKSILALLLAGLLLLTGCGKTLCSMENCKNAAVEDEVYGELYCEEHLASRKAFEISKQAFDKISSAYEIASNFSDDIYESWRMAIFNDDDILESGTAFLVKSLHISEKDLIDGLAYTVADLVDSEESATVAENGYELYSQYSYAIFQIMKSSLFTFCVRVTTNAYVLNGDAEHAETLLNEAKNLMKELNEKYADYEYYPKLKELLTQVTALLDFCNNSEGSFEQAKTTINDYKNSIRDLTNDLNYIFAE